MHETAILLQTPIRSTKGTREGKKGTREGKKGTREGKKGVEAFYFGLAGTLHQSADCPYCSTGQCSKIKVTLA